jgi:hypothetical protein
MRAFDVRGENIWQGEINAVRPVHYLAQVPGKALRAFTRSFFPLIRGHLTTYAEPGLGTFPVPHTFHDDARYIGDGGLMVIPLVGGWQHEEGCMNGLYGKRLDDVLHDEVSDMTMDEITSGVPLAGLRQIAARDDGKSFVRIHACRACDGNGVWRHHYFPVRVDYALVQKC